MIRKTKVLNNTFNVVCTRCGQCCHINGTRCRFLVKTSSGKTLCRIYRSRVGTIIGKTNGLNVICVNRKDLKLNFNGCPYNRPEWSCNTKQEVKTYAIRK